MTICKIIDADLNIEIDKPISYEETADDIDIKQLEDDRNSSTGNV